MTKKINHKKGQLAIQVLIYGFIAIILLGGFLIWADLNINAALREYNRTLAASIAEAGIEYYRWHLSHSPEDYRDGSTQPGPYIHDYYDKNGIKIGQFSLDIIPPPTGSTIVTIKSTGKIDADPTVEKIIEVRLGIPSFAMFSAVLDADVRFGEGTEVYGPIHSNYGIRFDGIAHNLVTSGVNDYNDPDHGGNNEYGVHTHKTEGGGVTDNSFRPHEAPPHEFENRPDVFLVGRQIGVPRTDFNVVTQTLSEIKDMASSSGFYRGPSGVGKFGYDVLLRTNGTFSLYEVTSLLSPPNRCSNDESQDGWGTWSIRTESLLGNYPVPANGLIFLEDNVWVRGQVNNTRVTIASARFPDNPSTRSSITVNNDVLYTNYNGTDAIALIAQKNINIGLDSEDDLRIDAALMAQNGRVGRYYYSRRCTPTYDRNLITIYGSIASSQRYGFAYTSGSGTIGYQNRNLIYDQNLLYAPPPRYPLTSDSYKIIYWNEIK